MKKEAVTSDGRRPAEQRSAMSTPASHGHHVGTQDFDEPLWFHATEVRTPIRAESVLRVQYNRSMRLSVEHHPMPTCATSLNVPFDRQQGKIRQCVPGVKRLFFIRRAKTVMIEQCADISCVRPQLRVFC